MTNLIKCSRCGTETSDFGWQDKAHTKPQSWCRPCFRQARKATRNADPAPSRAAAQRWYSNHREQALASRKAWNAAHDSEVRRHKVRYSAVKFGLNPAHVLAYYDQHSGLCDICSRPATSAYSPQHHKRLSVEHSHKLYLFRGLVCDDCNQLLKFAHDDVSRLQSAIQYLNEPPGESFVYDPNAI